MLASSYKGPSLHTQECPNEESQLFSHWKLRREVFLQASRLRDATSRRDGLSETFLRKHALNGISIAIMVGDREQAITRFAFQERTTISLRGAWPRPWTTLSLKTSRY